MSPGEGKNDEALFRGMQRDDDGYPAVGESARRLGVRREIDIEPDASSIVQPDRGGMSVSPGQPENLPRHRKPPGWGGTGLDQVWEISAEELGDELTYRPDPGQPEAHGFIEPRRPMTFAEYQDALAETRLKWRLVQPHD